MKFQDAVAPILAVQELIGGLKSQYGQLLVAINQIPEPYRTAAINETLEAAASWSASARAATGEAALGPTDFEAAATLPSATQAIFRLLEGKPDGLTSEEIQRQLAGKFQTTADKPERVISSTLSQLRANARLVYSEGRYKLLPSAGSRQQRGATLKERVESFFRRTGNKPATTLELATEAGVHPNAIRSLFSSSAPTFEIVEDGEREPNEPKLWKLNEQLFNGEGS